MSITSNDVRTEAETEVGRIVDRVEYDAISERARIAFDYASTACRVLHELWEFDHRDTAHESPEAVVARRRQFYDKAWALLRASRRAGVEAEDLLAARLDREVAQ